MMPQRNASVLKLTQLAILTAVVVLLQCFGGLLRLPFMGTAGNLVLVPIALGAFLLGPLAGAWLGLVCGVVILLYGVTGADPFTFLLFSASPWITALLCLSKTTLAGLASGYLYTALRHRAPTVSLFLSAAAVPVVNTGVFVLGSLALLDTISEIFSLGGVGVFSFVILSLAGVNFLFELGLTVVLTPTLGRLTSLLSRKA